jgi:hypothetical protein
LILCDQVTALNERSLSIWAIRSMTLLVRVRAAATSVTGAGRRRC